MAASFFFYDLETTGFDPRQARVMQFAGQRTNMDLEPIGDPVNVLIKLTPDVLPSPDAILITGITPQQTLADGLTEAEFLGLFYRDVAVTGTIFLGFNSLRFDDEFMRFMHWRNFYDAYEWQWSNSCSRWDLLDVVRMMRALRPEGIEWPFAPNGKPANRLEYLAQVNKFNHTKAHDALSDVQVTIDLARLVKDKQPKLFDHLLSMREKKKIAALVEAGEPFVYTSGHYSSNYLHTTAAVRLAAHPQSGASLVYDLRFDPAPFLKMNIEQLAEIWRFTRDPEAVRLPVKTLKYNRCPAIAPLGVIKDEATQQRIGLEIETVSHNLAILRQHQSEFAEKILKVVARLDEERATKAQTSLIDDPLTVDSRLYDGFVPDSDKHVMRTVRAAKPDQLSDIATNFKDERLKNLLPLYKARNFPSNLTDEERTAWDEFCHRQLLEGGTESRLAKYFARLAELAQTKLNGEQKFLLEELQLYGQSIMPVDAAD
jgi:exodeoxyribonuclease I